MTIKDYAKTIKVSGNKVTLPIAGRSVTIEVQGSKGKGLKLGAVALSVVLALVGIQ